MTEFYPHGSQRRLQKIYSDHYAPRTDQFLLRIGSALNEFYSKIECVDVIDIETNVEGLIFITEAYFIDVMRYKEYHQSPTWNENDEPTGEEWDTELHRKDNEDTLVNNAKRAAFLLKWLLKGRPILWMPVLSEDGAPLGEPENYYEVVNNIEIDFAISYILAEICQVDASSITEDEISIYTEMLRGLMYHLKYRNYDEKHFILFFESIIERWKK